MPRPGAPCWRRSSEPTATPPCRTGSVISEPGHGPTWTQSTGAPTRCSPRPNRSWRRRCARGPRAPSRPPPAMPPTQAAPVPRPTPRPPSPPVPRLPSTSDRLPCNGSRSSRRRWGRCVNRPSTTTWSLPPRPRRRRCGSPRVRRWRSSPASSPRWSSVSRRSRREPARSSNGGHGSIPPAGRLRCRPWSALCPRRGPRWRRPAAGWNRWPGLCCPVPTIRRRLLLTSTIPPSPPGGPTSAIG